MTCEATKLLMMDRLKTGSVTDALEAHLAVCPACAKEFGELETLWNGLGALPVEPLSPVFQRAFHQHLVNPAVISPKRLRSKYPWGLAAGFLMLVGFGLGLWMRSDFSATSPRDTNWALLHQPSVGGRLAGIALVTSTSGQERGPVSALFELIEQDPNVQVRLAAVEALYLFDHDDGLMPGLSEAIGQQKEPRVQVALIDLMVGLREKRGAEALRQLLEGGQLRPEARRRAELRLSEMPL